MSRSKHPAAGGGLSAFDSFPEMMAAVQAFHDKFQLKERGGEDLTYRVALMTEELGELAQAVTKGKSTEAISEEVADLFILLMGTAIAADFDLGAAFWTKMDDLMTREARMVRGTVRVSHFENMD